MPMLTYCWCVAAICCCCCCKTSICCAMASCSTTKSTSAGARDGLGEAGSRTHQRSQLRRAASVSNVQTTACGAHGTLLALLLLLLLFHGGWCGGVGSRLACKGVCVLFTKVTVEPVEAAKDTSWPSKGGVWYLQRVSDGAAAAGGQVDEVIGRSNEGRQSGGGALWMMQGSPRGAGMVELVERTLTLLLQSGLARRCAQ